MDFSFDQIRLANLFESGHNYISFSIMGMLIVFAGLALISIYITLLPKILNLPQKMSGVPKKKKEEGVGRTIDKKETELLLAIALALHLDQVGGSGQEKITWKRYEENDSAWLTASRMRGLAVRSHLPDRRP